MFQDQQLENPPPIRDAADSSSFAPCLSFTEPDRTHSRPARSVTPAPLPDPLPSGGVSPPRPARGERRLQMSEGGQRVGSSCACCSGDPPARVPCQVRVSAGTSLFLFHFRICSSSECLLKNVKGHFVDRSS